jgi:hypothetical protein
MFDLRFGLGLLGWCVIASFAACVSRGLSTSVRTLDESPRPQSPWIGRSQEELVAAWGQPAVSEADGEGGSILVYERPREWEYDLRDAPTTLEDETPLVLDHSINRRTAAKFWVGKDGKVYRVWLEEKMWKAGYPLPPRSGATTEAAGRAPRPD